jgi:hypothetical protein
MRIVLLFTFLTLFPTSVSAQQKPDCGQNDKNWLQQVINSIEDPSNILKRNIEGGYRGDCVKEPWMDQMQKLEVKQVTVTLSFKWHGGRITSLRVLQLDYHPEYYRNTIVINDPQKLGRIKRILDDVVSIAGLTKARIFMTNILERERKRRSASGTVFVELLDDERLPVTYDSPIINP